MQKRRIGRSDLEIAPLVFGGNVFGWTVDEAGSFQLLDAFVAAGGNCIDTADVYSHWVAGNQGGESETIIGRWLQARGGRDRLVIATKVGMPLVPDRKGLSRAYIMQAVEASLARLQTDYIDLYQSHTDDQEVTLEETLEAYARLVEQGKVRVIGASNYRGTRLARALEISETHGWPRYECLQPNYNLYDRADYEKDLRQVCAKHDVGVITYYSLAAGFLTGKYRCAADYKKSVRGARMNDRLNERGLRILAALDDVAKNTTSTPAAVALAWLMARPTITAPIASATTLAQLAELMRATQLRLDHATMARLDAASAY